MTKSIKLISIVLFCFVWIINSSNSKIKNNRFAFAFSASSGNEIIKSDQHSKYTSDANKNKTELSKKVNELFEMPKFENPKQTNQIQIENINFDKTTINTKSQYNKDLNTSQNLSWYDNNINNNFFHEFSLSFSLNFFSEIGDKSFVSIILIYDQISPIILFIVASITEILMNVFSVAIGYQLRTHPMVKLICQLCGTITAVVFSILLILEIISNEDEETTAKSLNEEEEVKKESESTIVIKEEGQNYPGNIFNINYILKITNVAWIIFLSELGDKSQITTIILSTEYNPCAILLGTAFAHLLGIILSMTIGYFISNHTNKRILSAFGAICFLYFGLQIGMGFFNSGGFKAILNSY